MYSESTARSLWTDAIFNFPADSISLIETERMDLINRAYLAIGNVVYGYIVDSHMDYRIFSKTTGSNWLASGTGTFTAATRTFTSATMYTNFTSADVGKIVTLHIGTINYFTKIESVTSTTAVVLSKADLPTTNGTVTNIMVVPSVIDTDGISISDLPLARGHQTRILLESSVTTNVHPLSLKDIRSWNNKSSQNRNKIVWCLFGDYLILRKHEDITNFGTLTLRYPKILLRLTGDDDTLRIPFGVEAACVTMLQHFIAQRIGKMDLSPPLQVVTFHINSFLQSIGVTIRTEESRKIMEALT